MLQPQPSHQEDPRIKAERLRLHALAKTAEALEAVSQYRKVAENDLQTNEVIFDQGELVKRSSLTLKESFIGSAGKACRRCGGSGRE